MNTKPENAKGVEEKKAPRKRGCLGCLLSLFVVFLFALVLFSTAAYFWSPWFTFQFLKFYGVSLNTALVKHYQISLDTEFQNTCKAQQGSPDFSAEKVKNEVLQKKKEEAAQKFSSILQLYKDKPDGKEWHETFKNLHASIRKVFEDEMVSPQEWSSFMQDVQKAIQAHSGQAKEQPQPPQGQPQPPKESKDPKEPAEKDSKDDVPPPSQPGNAENKESGEKPAEKTGEPGTKNP